MNDTLLSSLNTNDADVQPEKDSVGMSFGPLDSDIYKLTVEHAYLTVAASEALALNVLFKTEEGKALRQQFWMTSGKKKGKKNFYVNKDGEKHFLPGFNQANGLALLTCDKPIGTMITEKKTINLYDYDQKAEVPTEVDMVMELIGTSVSAGVVKQIVDKNIENADGIYVPSGITRMENEVDKFFYTDGRTVTEIKAGATEATFQKTWLERWQGQVKDKSVAKAGMVTEATPAAPGVATGSPVAGPATGTLFK